jgi:hypothetical protein
MIGLIQNPTSLSLHRIPLFCPTLSVTVKLQSARQRKNFRYKILIVNRSESFALFSA